MHSGHRHRVQLIILIVLILTNNDFLITDTYSLLFQFWYLHNRTEHIGAGALFKIIQDNIVTKTEYFRSRDLDTEILLPEDGKNGNLVFLEQKCGVRNLAILVQTHILVCSLCFLLSWQNFLCDV